MGLPLATPELKGTGGRVGPEPADFRVTEVPSYEPSGEGEHCFVRVRKEGLTSYEAAERLARALGVRGGDVGMAGLKDRWAVTEQWMSVAGIPPERALAVEAPGIEILAAARHPHKLRTGHLRGNGFRIRLVEVDAPDAATRAEQVLAALCLRGGHHYFGPQRFGRDGENVKVARALLRGETKVGDRRRRRLLISALQSDLFNTYLVLRREAGPLDRPLAGELVQRADSGGIFAAEDLDEVSVRLANGEVVPTGPLFGSKMRRPEPPTEAAALEERVLAEAGLERADFDAWKRLAPGARRALLVRPADPGVRPLEAGLELTFFLPAGAYATVVLEEVTKTPADALRPGRR